MHISSLIGYVSFAFSFKLFFFLRGYFIAVVFPPLKKDMFFLMNAFFLFTDISLKDLHAHDQNKITILIQKKFMNVQMSSLFVPYDIHLFFLLYSYWRFSKILKVEILNLILDNNGKYPKFKNLHIIFIWQLHIHFYITRGNLPWFEKQQTKHLHLEPIRYNVKCNARDFF